MNPTFLGLDEVLEIHRDQIERHGGSLGVRDLGLLESALAMPRAGSRGTYFHADVHEMGAAYLFHIVKNHPFVDGNKRAGAMAAYVFLRLNGLELTATNPDLVDLVLGVAENRFDKADVAAFIREHSTN
jgi:death-on-curing protein